MRHDPQRCATSHGDAPSRRQWRCRIAHRFRLASHSPRRREDTTPGGRSTRLMPRHLLARHKPALSHRVVNQGTEVRLSSAGSSAARFRAAMHLLPVSNRRQQTGDSSPRSVLGCRALGTAQCGRPLRGRSREASGMVTLAALSLLHCLAECHRRARAGLAQASSSVKRSLRPVDCRLKPGQTPRWRS